MVTLSVTRSRVADVLNAAADGFDEEPWEPYLNPLLTAIDRAAGYTPGSGTPDAEAATLAAWELLAAHLGGWPGDWERKPERQQDEIQAALRGAAGKAVAS
ncbi:hypothetical protein ABZ915_17445 [Streptomyces sp. NPDC046915]|uniref:DUF6197 family protein n=1 Tax=Streptomyces sp. NPDC046915 TaxID=3155257 RepID=UPI0033D6145F